MALALPLDNLSIQTTCTYKRRDLIPAAPAELWQIQTGVVRTLTWDDEGNVSVLGFWGNGDIVGQPLSDIQFYHIECLTPVTACLLFPGYRCQRDRLLRYLKRTEQLLSIAQLRSVKKRLVHFLNYLAQQFGETTDQGIALNFHLTHQDIADVIGSSRVTVTRIMGDLSEQGQIQWHQKRFLLLQMPISIDHPD